MIRPGYDGNRVPPTESSGQIRVTIPVFRSKTFSKEEKVILTKALSGESVCPPMYFFRATPETRRIFGLPAVESEAEQPK